MLGSSRRSRWASIFSEGIGAATINNSGKIDVHMVSHEQANRGLELSSISPRTRQVVSWLAAVTMPWAILAVTVRLDPALDLGAKSALFFAGVIGVALFGGVAPAVLSGLLSGALLDYFHTEPRYSFAVANTSNLLTIVLLLGVAMAIAVLVDAAASRAPRGQASGPGGRAALRCSPRRCCAAPISIRSWSGCARRTPSARYAWCVRWMVAGDPGRGS